jgi:hypothetical protein
MGHWESTQPSSVLRPGHAAFGNNVNGTIFHISSHKYDFRKGIYFRIENDVDAAYGSGVPARYLWPISLANMFSVTSSIFVLHHFWSRLPKGLRPAGAVG